MGTKFKLELNLQQMASIRIAANIWLSRPRIAKISALFLSRKTNEPNFLNQNRIKIEMSKQFIDIFERVDSMKLPYAIKNYLLYVMRPVEENLLDYLERTCKKCDNLIIGKHFPTIEKFCKYIEFDCFGRVDEVKTCLNIYNANDENFSLPFLFYEACTYCIEDIIYSTWNKCSEHMKFEIQMTLSKAGKSLLIVNYWIQFVDKRHSIFTTETTEIDALEYCVERANTVGVKYFINELSQDDKNKIILPLVKEGLVRGVGYLIGLLPKLEAKQHVCNLFFMLAHMTEVNKNQLFILYKPRITLLFSKEWPWKYLLSDLDYCDNELYRLIKIIVERIVDDYDRYKKIVFTDLWMIPEIWKKCSDNFGKSIVEICWSIDKSIMFKLQAVILVTSVIDDTDGVNKLRPEISKGFELYYNDLFDKQKYEVVDLYLKNILQNDEERKPYEELLQSK